MSLQITKPFIAFARTVLLNVASHLDSYILNFSVILVVPTLCSLEVEWVSKSVLLHTLYPHNELDLKVEGTKMLHSKCMLANGIVLYGIQMPLFRGMFLILRGIFLDNSTLYRTSDKLCTSVSAMHCCIEDSAQAKCLTSVFRTFTTLDFPVPKNCEVDNLLLTMSLLGFLDY